MGTHDTGTRDTVTRNAAVKRTRLPAAERRAQIALAALRIIGERGPKALTTATLADAVGVTSGALFRHFSSLDAILREAVRIAIERVEATFPDDALEGLERLMALAGNRVEVLGADRGLAWMLRSEEASLVLPDDAVSVLKALVQRSRAYLLDALEQGVARGTIRDDIATEHLLIVVVGTIHTLIGMPGISGRAKRPRRRAPRTTLDALRVLLSPPARRAP